MRSNDRMDFSLRMQTCKGMLLCEQCFLVAAAGSVADTGRAASNSLCSQGIAVPEVPTWVMWSISLGWGTCCLLQWPLCEAAHRRDSREVLSLCQEGSLQNNILRSVRWQQEEEDPQLKAPFAACFCLMALKHAKDVRELIVNFLCLMFFFLSWAYIQT